jgi:hypothetical protein
VAASRGGCARRALLGASCILLAAAGPAAAKTFEVNTRSDHTPGKCSPKDCTLREAVIRANGHDGQDRIVVPGGDPYPLTRGGSDEDAAKKGDLDLADDQLDIRGKGRRPTVVKQTVADRVFEVVAGANVVIERLTIRGGRSVQRGGGVYTEGELFLGEVIVRDNRAQQGGGAAAFGEAARLQITNSTVRDNRAGLWGGGASILAAGNVGSGTLQSTISGNRAPQGAGIFFLPGDVGLSLVTSTITGNVALPPDPGPAVSTAGGLHVESTFSSTGTVKIGQTTIAANQAPPDQAANIHAERPTQLENTLIADPVGAPSCDVAIDSAGHNLDEGTTCGLDQGTDVEGADAALKPLGDNGGLTPTMALKAASGAIEEGTCPGTLIQRGVDQRGAGRPSVSLGLSCDIGAFERDPISPPPD